MCIFVSFSPLFSTFPFCVCVYVCFDQLLPIWFYILKYTCATQPATQIERTILFINVGIYTKTPQHKRPKKENKILFRVNLCCRYICLCIYFKWKCMYNYVWWSKISWCSTEQNKRYCESWLKKITAKIKTQITDTNQKKIIKKIHSFHMVSPSNQTDFLFYSKWKKEDTATKHATFHLQLYYDTSSDESISTIQWWCWCCRRCY